MKRIGTGLFVTTLLAAATTVGCRDEDRIPSGVGGDASLGGIQLALVATGASGAVYRLRDGVFDIWSSTTGTVTTVSTEDDPDAETIDIALDPGGYEVYLNDGYRLERLDTGDTETATDGAETDDIVIDRMSAKEIDQWKAAHPRQKLPLGRWGDNASAARTASMNSTDLSSSAEAQNDDTSVETTLISDNPVYAEVASETTTMVNFAFLVNGEIVGPAEGTLSIGITVEETDASDCTDDYEPNDEFDAPSAVSFDPPIEATACPGDDDYYIFTPPVAAGEFFVVDILFSHAVSDVDAILFDADGMEVSYSGSVTDNEHMGAISDGRSYILDVYPFYADVPNTYTVTFGEVEESDCCTESLMPGCADPEVEACVCDHEPWCCEGGFDLYCVETAFAECAVECELSDGDCCRASNERGCGDTDIQRCVCSVDPVCCTDEYDAFCVQEATGECGLTCNTAAPDSDCCTVGENPGCTDAAVEACVCDIDPVCCAGPFDSNCVGLAADVCGASC